MLNYKNAGVDIDKSDILTGIIRDTVKSENIGLFAGIFEHPLIPEYAFVGCTDGVGTKIVPLLERGMIGTIATDLIAMNLNDLATTGAAPAFFLDYFATHSLDIEVTSRFIRALKDELSKYNCVLLGGETAELKGLLTEGHFDVGGFALGIGRKDKLLNPNTIKDGDILVGLKSSGPHSNGFTLIRNLFDQQLLNESDMLNCLKPTHIYINEILELANQGLIKACAHITGGGIEGNLSRILPSGLCADVYIENIPEQEIFSKISGIIGKIEAYKTFNMGVGMIMAMQNENKEKVFEICSAFEPFEIGRVIKDEASSGVRLR